MLTFHEPFEFLACKRENNNLYNFKQAHKISASKPRVIIVTNVDTNIKHKKNLTKKLFPDTLQEMMTMTMPTIKMMTKGIHSTRKQIMMQRISTRAV